jgi:hypothetical protein
MPIKKTKTGFTATYGGDTRNFKRRDAAEKWSAKYKRPKVGRTGRMGRTSRAY